MATWSFNPTLPSDKITTAETNGKLVITVLSGKFTSDTAYTVTYNDGNGCSASTKFYIKNDCSGGGGGGGTESAYINLNIRNYLDHDVYINGENIIYVSASTSDNRIGVKMNIKNRSSECAMFKIPKMTNNIPGERSFSYSDIDFTVNWDGHNMSSVYGKPYTTDTPKVYTYLCNTTTDCSKRDGSHNSDKIIMSQLEGNFPNTPTSSNPATITLTIDNDNGDERDYYKCEGGCAIEGKVLAATDSGEQSIGSLPTNGTWSFIPTHVDWLGDISQVGTNVMASNVITNDGNSRYVVFTGTCADCSDCTGTHTFKVTQNGNGGGGGSCDSLPKTNPFHITLNISVPAAIDGWTYDEGQSIDLTNNTLKIEIVKLYLIDKCECEGTDDEGHDYTRPYSKYGVAFGQTTRAGGSLHEIPIGMITPVDFYLYDKDGDSSQYVGMENANIGTKFLKNGEIPGGSEHMIYVKGTYKDDKSGQIISSDHIGQYVTCVFEDENYTLQDGGTYNVTLQKY